MVEAFGRLLPDWKQFHVSACSFAQGEIWRDETGLIIRGGLNGHYELSFAGSASFLVNVPRKTVQIVSTGTENDREVEHLLLDQVVPRILAHFGRLTIHGAGIVVDDRLIVILGKSGRGKSTITAWLVSEGYAIVGDDAVVIDLSHEVCGSGIGPKLRLRKGSAHFMAGHLSAPPIDAGYSDKVRFDLPFSESLTAPIAAIFKLVEPEEEIRLERISPSFACMALIEESFALDPVDFRRASAKLNAAAEVAERVPFYELAYPRRFEKLAAVRDAIIGVI